MFSAKLYTQEASLGFRASAVGPDFRAFTVSLTYGLFVLRIYVSTCTGYRCILWVEEFH